MFGKKKQVSQEVPVNPEIVAAEKQYRRDMAVVESGPRLRRVSLIAWVALDIVLLLIFVMYLGYYLVFASNTDRELYARISQNVEQQNRLTAERAAASLQIQNPKALDLGEGYYDLTVMIENPNEDWFATFDYAFTDNGESTEVYSGFILPLQERPLMAFRQSFDRRPSGANIVIENIQWYRIDHHVIEDIGTWMDQHLDFTVQEASYEIVRDDAGERGVSHVVIENASAYGYWDATMLVVIRQGNTVLGVNTFTLSEFGPGDVREADVFWFDGKPSAGVVEVYPVINIFDEAEYMSLPEGSGEDIRSYL